MKKQFKKLMLITLCLSILFNLSGCVAVEYEVGRMKEHLKGRNAIIQTYDEDSNLIDKIEGKSISIASEDKFDIKDEEGKTSKKSSVINVTVGNDEMLHVGSSLILYEDGLQNIFEDYAKKVDVKNLDRAYPFINRMINEYKNVATGKKRVILVRSQTGKPLATFVGNSVSYFATGIPKSTGIQIDGKYLFIYQCDYTIYDLNLIN